MTQAPTPNGSELLREQREYYEERAPEYEDWWFRRGIYDGGETANERWFAEVREVEEALDRFAPRGRVLELACGTGIWTRKLATQADHVIAVDASPQVLALNRAALPARNVTWLQADLFEWRSAPVNDVCFFGFWLSHVPDAFFEEFWTSVRGALKPGGRVFFVDSGPREKADSGGEVTMRKLDDGRRFHIIKRFYTPGALENRLRELGWRAHVRATAESFIYGCAVPGDDPAASL